MTLLIVFGSFMGFSQKLYLKFHLNPIDGDSIKNPLQPVLAFNNLSDLKAANEESIRKLQYKGYINLRAKRLNAINDSVFDSHIDLGRKFEIVYIKNHSAFEENFKNLNPYIKVEELSEVMYALLNKFVEDGKPFSQVKLQNIAIDQTDTLSASLEFYESDKRTLDEIVLRGYDKFPKAFLNNYANLKTGATFNREDLVEQSEKLDLLPFANQVKTPQVQFTPDSTKLFLYLERSQANSFDGFLGFNNSDDNNFQLNGNIDLRLVNNFHAGEELNLNYRNDGNAQEWFDATVRLPFLLGSKFSFEAGLGFFKQDSTFSNNSQQLKLDYQIRQNINIGSRARFESSTNLLDANTIREDIQDYDKSSYGLEVVYNNPTRFSKLFLASQYVRLGFGIGQRETAESKEQQQYINLKGRQIFKIDKRQYVYTGVDAGYLNSDFYFSNELFRFGGINSIRGFAENRFFANIYGTVQTEYRYILGSNLYIHSVLDYGFYENDIDRFSENLYSIGLGFGLETQAGVLRLIFANGGSDSQNIEFKNTQIHLKFLSTF